MFNIVIKTIIGAFLALLLVNLTDNLAFSQSNLDDFAQDSDYIEREIGIDGKNLVPRFLLPGFILLDPANQDYIYPMYYRVLRDDLPQLTESNLGKLVDDSDDSAKPQNSAAANVLVLSSGLSDNKSFENQNPLVDLLVISDLSPVVSLSLNGVPLNTALSSLIETELRLNLEKGLNNVKISGRLEDGGVFSREYNVFYQSIITSGYERDWRILLNTELGGDFNSEKNINLALATDKISDLSMPAKSDFFYHLSATVFDPVNQYFDWYAGIEMTRYASNKADKNSNRYLAYLSLNGHFKAFSLAGWLSFLFHDSLNLYVSTKAIFSYDFNYTPEVHSGVIFSAHFAKNFNNLPALPKKDALISFGFDLTYNGYYLVDWISLTTINLSFTHEDLQTMIDKHYLIGGNIKFTWNKTYWDIFLNFSYFYKIYPHYGSIVINPNPSNTNFKQPKRNDHIFTPSIKLNYTVLDGLSLYTNISWQLGFSNTVPYHQPLFLVGADYLF